MTRSTRFTAGIATAGLLLGLLPGAAAGAAAPLVAETPPVGTVRPWPAFDLVKDSVYYKDFTLRGVGENIEVWVASGPAPDDIVGTDLPPGDCRTQVPDSTTITDAQVAYLIDEYDTNIFPTESAAFSVAPDRDGSTRSPGLLLRAGKYQTRLLDFTGAGHRVVTLVDNIRDPNFYAYPKNRTAALGLFSPVANDLTGRNVMTIDAFDWEHLSGSSPPDDPNPDLCKSRPALPGIYEGTFAHEYQHLLQYYLDPNEAMFLREGLGDYAASLTGYTRPDRTVFQRGTDGHIACFQGFGTVRTKYRRNPQPCGGPQNSLTLWGDEGNGSQIQADYGVAWSFLLFLRDRYGEEILRAIHRDSAAQGLASVQRALDRHAKGTTVAAVLRDFQLMTLIDQVAGADGSVVTGARKGRVTTASLTSSVNLANPASYARPGAAPNGADYVPVRGAGDASGQLRSLTFVGAAGKGIWSVQLVGLDEQGKRVHVQRSTGRRSVKLTRAQLGRFAAFPVLVAIIGYHDPTETMTSYAPYTLKTNGATQPGGGD